MSVTPIRSRHPRVVWTNDPEGRSVEMPDGTKVTLAYGAPLELAAAMTVAVIQAWDTAGIDAYYARCRALDIDSGD